METYLAGAYWGPRKETARECAERISLFLIRLSSISNDLTGWRSRGRSRKLAAGNTIIDPNSLCQIVETVEAGTNRKDVGAKDTISELGFRVGLWNGKTSSVEALSLGIHCGAYSGLRTFENNAIISPLLSFDISSDNLVQKLSETFVEAWNPEFFVLARKSKLNDAASGAGKAGGHWEPFLDCALFLDEKNQKKYSPTNYHSQRDCGNGRLFLNVPPK
jgi:hypothetical protein